MPNAPLQFTEIEHKFLVGEAFDLPAFRAALDGLGPTKTTAVRVRDRYFLTEGSRDRRFVVRHRYDEEIHQLTIKTIEPDAEVRVEVNLDLGHHAGDQRAQVDAFLDQLGVRWRGTIHKDIEVWHFPDCEAVYYEASTGARSVRCVEFEATRKDSLEEALAAVARYEHATGFDPSTRSPRSLLETLFPEVADLFA